METGFITILLLRGESRGEMSVEFACAPLPFALLDETQLTDTQQSPLDRTRRVAK